MTATKAPWWAKSKKPGERHLFETAHGTQVEAWDATDTDGYSHWCIARNNDGCITTAGYVRVKMERFCRDDVSGDRKFKVVSRAHYFVTIACGYKHEFEIPEEYIGYGGEVECVRSIMRSLVDPEGSWLISSQLSLESACRKAGASERAIMDAVWSDYGENTRQNANLRLCHLLAKQTEQTTAIVNA